MKEQHDELTKQIQLAIERFEENTGFRVLSISLFRDGPSRAHRIHGLEIPVVPK